MPSMSGSRIELQSWKARRSQSRGTQNYSLYDSVYLYKDDVAEPYIGKIIKIWGFENNSSRAVQILWFFRPSEISSYTRGLQVLKNELFLGTGASIGLGNINSVKAIAGKCNVVCISTDKRNQRPSPEEVSMAEFVFYRTFDVDKFTISDELGESIFNVKVELLLNNKNPQIRNRLKIESNDEGDEKDHVRDTKRTVFKHTTASQRPDADSSKWFTGLPWEDRMKGAQEDGTLVLLQNLDPTYTSSEIEDIVWHTFRESCTAKVLLCAAISSPHSVGQAFVIFRTKQAAVNVVQKLEEGCLILSNGRPLLGRVVGHLPGKSSLFPGHLHVGGPEYLMRKNKRDAASTSHGSEDDNFEYDMAMEWRLLKERSKLMQSNLLKKQGEEDGKLQGNLKIRFKTGI